jgi:hypothetical protein
MQDGRLETARESIVSVLDTRFTNVPSGISEKLNSIADYPVLGRVC